MGRRHIGPSYHPFQNREEELIMEKIKVLIADDAAEIATYFAKIFEL
jgi:hypothetical protein